MLYILRYHPSLHIYCGTDDIKFSSLLIATLQVTSRNIFRSVHSMTDQYFACNREKQHDHRGFLTHRGCRRALPYAFSALVPGYATQAEIKPLLSDMCSIALCSIHLRPAG